jgi:hypothetical protein
LNYIIARDNETMNLVTILSQYEAAIILLTDHAIKTGERDTKWQLSTILHKLKDKVRAIALLDKLVVDEEEYVNRRALMELARLKSDKVALYCQQFWDKDKYGDMEEYQRIAVLHALNLINSSHLTTYIEKAKKDGRKYLVQNALDIEKTRSSPPSV